ncbi:MAG: hypothetical protein IGS23_23095 [Rivularia sp. T60_A2020_040]|nr:hypothetical protein [Rivularia sp. T60_A2020_040]
MQCQQLREQGFQAVIEWLITPTLKEVTHPEDKKIDVAESKGGILNVET